MLGRCAGVLQLPPDEAASGTVLPDVVLQLSIDGSDLIESPDASWGIDSAGRILARPREDCA
jgi:hypothetical protein